MTYASPTGPTNEEIRMVYHCPGGCLDFTFDIETSRQRILGPSQTLYQYYLHRNTHPSLLEAASIRADLKEATSTVSVITDIVTRLKERIDTLEAEKGRINQVVVKYQSILRPIHRLPAELLARIFSFCVETPEMYASSGHRKPPFSPLNSRRPPWSLAQVCQSFRNLALATPSLWSFISFGFHGFYSTADADSATVVRAHNHLLRLQLQRSQNSPLTVVTHMPEGAMSSIDRSLFLLCSHTHRWRSLRIELNDAVAEELVHIRGLLPELELLDIHCMGWGFKGELDFLEFAPRLRKLILSGGHNLIGDGQQGWSSALKLPFRQITDLCHFDANDGFRLDGHDLLQLLAFLPRFVALERLTLFLTERSVSTYLRLRSSVPVWAAEPQLHRLTELELHGYDPDDPDDPECTEVDEVLCSMVAPSLSKLTISTSGSDCQALVRFLSRPGRPLTSLTIHRVNMPSEEFLEVLAQLNSLAHLAFGVDEGMSNDYLMLFYSPEGSKRIRVPIVPRLQNLTLIPVLNAESSYNGVVLVDVLEDRWRIYESTSDSSSSGPWLKSVKLDQRLADRSAIARLNRLREEGLQVLEP
ncbi:hypothetical protein PQX77_016278 [Marasmius sp. AFHP31]|nr:hypothetical protein PQX77_016278 [Marasmius sp. AFHP31]